MAMTIQMNRTLWGTLFVGLTAWISLGGAVSCLSDDQAPGGGRVEHPVEPGPKAKPSPTASAPSSAVALPAASAVVTSAPVATSTPSVERRLSPSERFEELTGIKLSELEKTIMDDCPERAWSKSVPKRRCTKDNECGDGFCDRGRCAPVWSCTSDYGQPCERDNHCGVRPCIDGRCRSCKSDTECTGFKIQDAKCVSDPFVPGARECIGVFPSIPGEIAPAKPPQNQMQ